MPESIGHDIVKKGKSRKGFTPKDRAETWLKIMDNDTNFIFEYQLKNAPKPDGEVSYDKMLGYINKEGKVFAKNKVSSDEEKKYLKGLSRYGYMNGKCYYNAGITAVSDPRYKYYEGFAHANNIGNFPLMHRHAWVVDEKGNAIDVTWEEGGSNYHGVQIPTSYINDRMFATHKTGPFLAEYYIKMNNSK